MLLALLVVLLKVVLVVLVVLMVLWCWLGVVLVAVSVLVTMRACVSVQTAEKLPPKV